MSETEAAEPSGRARTSPSRLRRDLPWAVALLVAIAALWLTVYDRWSPASWPSPIVYGGDATAFYAHLRAARDGHIVPAKTIEIPELNAPYQAQWNDYPRLQRVLLWAMGQVARTRLGLFGVTSLALLFAHLAAGLVFFGVARFLRMLRPFAWSGGFLFAATSVIWSRSAGHLVLSFYWHIPCALLVVGLCARPRGLALRGGRFAFAFGTTVVTALLSVYYAVLYVQLLCFAALAQLLRRNYHRLLAPCLLVVTVGSVFVGENAGTLLYPRRHGVNSEALMRNYADLERYALRPAELFVPLPRLGLWHLVRQPLEKYYGIVPGEKTTYLGLPAVAGLAVVFWPLLQSVLRRRSVRVSAAAFTCCWAVAYAVVGGINTTAGATIGFMLLRGGNRLSIWLVAIGLLVGGKRLSRLTAGRPAPARVLLAAAFVVLGLLDHGRPPEQRGAWRTVASTVSEDRRLVAAMEAVLPRGAMVFQYPPTKFPETAPAGLMGFYEHLVPYLFSSRLRFSHGTDKGRARETWQEDVASLSAREMVTALEEYGFSAILVCRRGLTTWDADLVQTIRREGRSVIAEEPEQGRVVLRLEPSPTPRLPHTPPLFTRGWHGSRLGEARWTHNPNALVVLHNPGQSGWTVRFSFTLLAPDTRVVSLARDKTTIARWDVDSTGRRISLPLLLPPGETRLTFSTRAAEGALQIDGRRRFGRFALADTRLGDAASRQATP